MLHLPFEDESQDFVYASHVLEHVPNERYIETLKEWHRVVKLQGHLIISVPHQYLYEKKASLPSRFSSEHKRFYTPASLLKEIEQALFPNSYRIVHFQDCDDGYKYHLPPDQPSKGEYQIECVLQKIRVPLWSSELISENKD